MYKPCLAKMEWYFSWTCSTRAFSSSSNTESSKLTSQQNSFRCSSVFVGFNFFASEVDGLSVNAVLNQVEFAWIIASLLVWDTTVFPLVLLFRTAVGEVCALALICLDLYRENFCFRDSFCVSCLLWRHDLLLDVEKATRTQLSGMLARASDFPNYLSFGQTDDCR